jgi:CHAT domain-containing protein/tetratricopeptide (TPR) repeat protein
VRRLPSSALFILLAALAATVTPAAAHPTGSAADRSTAWSWNDQGAQPSRSPDTTDASIDRAFAFILQHQTARAERLLMPLLASNTLTARQRARAERALGQAYVATGQRARAGESFARALEAASAAGDRSEVGWARRWRGVVHYGDGQPELAQTLWELAREDFVAAHDAYGEFEVLDDIAVKLTGLNRRPSAERCFAIARAQHDVLLEARARARWGHGLLEAGLPGPALIELERATAAMRPLGARADPHLGDALAALGWALRWHGANARAVPIHREAIRLARARGDDSSLMWNFLGLGLALSETGHVEEAEMAMRAGLQAARRLEGSTDIRLLTESLGGILLKRGRWADAAGMIEQAESMPGVETNVTPLVNLSEAYRRLHRLSEADARAATAVDHARRLGLVEGEIRALIETAHVAVARGELGVAERTLADVADRLESYRASLAPVDFLKRGFGDRFSDAYGLMVGVLMRRGRPREALAAAERARSRAFADLLAARRGRESEQALASRYLLEELGEVSTMTTDVPDSPRATPALDPDELAALARRLSSTLVIYWIHESGSYVWVVDAGGRIDATAIRTSLPALRRAVYRAVDVPPEIELTPASSNSVASVRSGREAFAALYAALWAPIEGFLPATVGARITIVPHGPLLAVPFGALTDRRGRYVIERYALHYAPSGAVLREALDRTASLPSPIPGIALLVADPAPLPRSGAELPALPGARREVQAVARLFPKSTETLVGRAASEHAVRAELPRARLAHFATHALVRDTDALTSHLLLGAAASPSRLDDDGQLTASEIASMRLTSDLVVLGACRSARGPISSDGIAGLTRAFMAAGAPSVVATLWDVADGPTAEIMVPFYAAYAAGAAKDDALRRAQLALLARLRQGRVLGSAGHTRVRYPEHPWLWAAPMLVGAP